MNEKVYTNVIGPHLVYYWADTPEEWEQKKKDFEAFIARRGFTAAQGMAFLADYALRRLKALEKDAQKRGTRDCTMCEQPSVTSELRKYKGGKICPTCWDEHHVEAEEEKPAPQAKLPIATHPAKTAAPQTTYQGPAYTPPKEEPPLPSFDWSQVTAVDHPWLIRQIRVLESCLTREELEDRAKAILLQARQPIEIQAIGARTAELRPTLPHAEALHSQEKREGRLCLMCKKNRCKGSFNVCDECNNKTRQNAKKKTKTKEPK